MTQDRLIIDLHRQTDGASEIEVKIDATLPNRYTAGFTGLGLEEVVQRIPLLFSVCGGAQGYCASQTAESLIAEPDELDGLRSRARAIVTLAETAKELTFRILMEYADQTNDRTLLRQFAPAIQWKNASSHSLFQNQNPFALFCNPAGNKPDTYKVIDEIEAYLEDAIFGGKLYNWLSLNSFNGLVDWSFDSHALGAKLVRAIFEREHHLLSPCDLIPLNGYALSEVFSHFVTHETGDQLLQRGEETGSLSRQKKHPLIQSLNQDIGYTLLARYCGRLIELASIPAHMRSLLESDGAISDFVCMTQKETENSAISSLETARGRLYHALTVEDHTVMTYKILSPTQWNFHESSIATTALKKLKVKDKDDLQRQAQLMVRAIDPCVGFEVRVH